MKEGLSAIFLLTCLAGCVHEPVNPENGDGGEPVVSEICDPDTAYFQNQVLPVFIANCAIPGCHDAASREEGVVLDSYANIKKWIRPGSPGESEIYEVLVENDPEDLMPRNPVTQVGFRLPQEQIDLIAQWIEQGAINNSCASCDTTDYTFSGAIHAIISRNCATSVACHGANSQNGDFRTYEGVAAKVGGGRLEQRVLILQDMPPGAPLPACEQDLIAKWIEAGALNN